MKWTFMKHFIGSVVIVIIAVIAKSAFFTPHSAASIGIIGGADGPTAIYTSGVVSGVVGYGIFLLGFVVLLLLYLPYKFWMLKKK